MEGMAQMELQAAAAVVLPVQEELLVLLQVQEIMVVQVNREEALAAARSVELGDEFGRG